MNCEYYFFAYQIFYSCRLARLFKLRFCFECGYCLHLTGAIQILSLSYSLMKLILLKSFEGVTTVVGVMSLFELICLRYMMREQAEFGSQRRRCLNNYSIVLDYSNYLVLCLTKEDYETIDYSLFIENRGYEFIETLLNLCRFMDFLSCSFHFIIFCQHRTLCQKIVDFRYHSPSDSN